MTGPRIPRRRDPLDPTPRQQVTDLAMAVVLVLIIALLALSWECIK